jgi:hypothetical protein
MDTRYHFFLTIILFSVFIGYGFHDFSVNDMSDFSRITDIDIAEREVTLKTSCFSLSITGSEASIDDLERAAYQDELPYSLELFEANLSKDSELKRLEINGDSGLPVTVLVLENGDRLEIEAITGLMLAAENNIPVYLEKGFIRSSGEPTCLDQSIEI